MPKPEAAQKENHRSTFQMNIDVKLGRQSNGSQNMVVAMSKKLMWVKHVEQCPSRLIVVCYYYIFC